MVTVTLTPIAVLGSECRYAITDYLELRYEMSNDGDMRTAQRQQATLTLKAIFR